MKKAVKKTVKGAVTKKAPKDKKKHIDQFFQTKGPRKHTYYFKDKKIWWKSEKNRNNHSLSTGYTLGIRAQKSVYLGEGPLLSCLKILKRVEADKGCGAKIKTRVRAFPDFVLTAKPREVRMGKGKGAPDKKICYVKRGMIPLEFSCKREDEHKAEYHHIINSLRAKLPFPSTFVTRFW
eukprot:TRINITY_DN5473_c0_g1_i1.p1 TRINITY_DN5473_c0_g1~~TRINITY_DN5473_c0_g1_i1.p1  ORF type:complete len:179 (+),score=29.31 TRINITY_DN5473_c0_g1_i1:73-609(+)